jgi:hypothetical protein
MRLKDQTEEAFAEDFGTFPDTGEAPKGKGYIELLVDNIVGLDNEYESFGEAFGKSFNEDELGTLKNMALSAYEGAKEFVTSPIETTKDVATEISDSVSRLGAESLDGRIKRMYGVGYQDATEEQVTKAREAVIGDAITASSLVPAAKGATTVAKAAIPGKVQADVVGQMRSILDGDTEFRTESKNPPVGLSADVVGSQEIKTPQRFQAGEYTKAPPSYKVPEAEITKFETLVASPASSVVTHRVAKDLEAISNLGEIPVGKFIDLQEDLAFVADSQRDKVVDSFLKNNNVTFGDVKDAGYTGEKEALKYYAMGVQFSEANKEYQRFLNQNNLLHQSDIRTPLQKPFEISYRDPVMEIAEGLSFPKNGMKGSDFIKVLDKSPAAKSALYNSADLGIDKSKFYTKEDLLSTIEPKTWKGSFAVQDYPRYRRTQIQEFDDMEADGDYKEILFNVERKDKSLPTFDIPEELRKEYGSYHFPENTLAHARISTNENFGTGQKELLVHEFQSDYLQKGAKKAGPGADIAAVRASAKEVATRDIDKELLTPDVQAVVDRALNDPESNRLGWIDGGLERELREDLKKAGLSFDDRNALLLNIQDGLVEIASADTRGATKLPVGNVSDAVENLLDGVLGYAQDTGVDKVFIPSLEQIVGHEGRFKPGSFEFFEQTQPGSFFYQTYVTGLDKATRDLSDTTNATVTREVKTTGGSAGQPRMYVGLPDDIAAAFTKDMKVAKLYNDMLNDRITEEQLLKASGLEKEGLKSFRDNYREEFDKASKARDRDWLKTFKKTAYNDAVKTYGELKTLDTPGTMIDISEAKTRFDFTKPKMAKGGLVKTFAEGGMIEDDQMNRLMQEGGMADDGMSREPVTGNEIPPGSLVSEVRDDIPAQLSEGEYVVPADVLRYYGVRFFEDLRAQAKQGMMEMESDGRIGGTPVDAQGVPAGGMDEELTPEEEQMLMEALGGSRTAPTGMAYGGMTEQPISTPYQDQATMYQMPTGMQEGGMAFDRTKFTLGDDTSSGIEARRYINPTTKEERTVNFLNGIPLGIIPEGFVPWTKELADQPKPGTETGTTTGTPEVKTERDDRGRDRDQTPTTGEGSTGWAEKNYDAFTADPYGFGMKALEGANKNNMGVLGKVGALGVFGDAGKVKAISEANLALSRVTDEAQREILQEGIANLTESISSPLVYGGVKSGLLGSGKNLIKQVEEYTSTKTPTTSAAAPTVGTPTTSTQKDNKPSTTDSGNRLGFSPSTPSKDVGVTRTGGDRKSIGFGTSVGKVDTKSTSDKGLSMGTSGGTPGRTNTGNNPGNPNAPGYSGRSGTGNVGTGTSGSYGQGGSNATRRAEGGLISKPKKTTRGKKGLAS